MTLLLAGITAVAVYLLATRRSDGRLGDRLASYVMAERSPGPAEPGTGPRIPGDIVRRVTAAGAGAVIGALIGLTTPAAGGARPVLGMALAGAGSGFLAVKVAATQRAEARRRTLRQELPTVADALALHIQAGDPIPTAIARLCAEAGGVVVSDLERVLVRHRSGTGLAEALGRSARAAEHPDAARLYEALAHAHHTGGRLADRLTALAQDFRSAISRDLVAEGGRRALATYGPILALQIPVTLLFLVYPTLVSLGELSATP